MTTRTNILTQTLTVVGLSALLLTGCSAPAPNQKGPVVSETATPSASETTPAGSTTEPAAVPSDGSGSMTAAQAEDPYGWGLVSVPEVAAGSDLKVSGGQYAPGVTVTVYGQQQMGQPSYDAANDMYVAGEEVFLTEKVQAVTNDKGQFDTKIPVPAGVAPQLMNVVAVGSDGSGFLVMTTVK